MRHGWTLVAAIMMTTAGCKPPGLDLSPEGSAARMRQFLERDWGSACRNGTPFVFEPLDPPYAIGLLARRMDTATPTIYGYRVFRSGKPCEAVQGLSYAPDSLSMVRDGVKVPVTGAFQHVEGYEVAMPAYEVHFSDQVATPSATWNLTATVGGRALAPYTLKADLRPPMSASPVVTIDPVPGQPQVSWTPVSGADYYLLHVYHKPVLPAPESRVIPGEVPHPQRYSYATHVGGADDGKPMLIGQPTYPEDRPPLDHLIRVEKDQTAYRLGASSNEESQYIPAFLAVAAKAGATVTVEVSAVRDLNSLPDQPQDQTAVIWDQVSKPVSFVPKP